MGGADWTAGVTGPASSQVRCGYMYNPWEKYDATNDRYYFEDGLVLAKHPNNRFIASDLIWGFNVTSHVSGQIATWNLAYPDGHVATMTSDASDPNSLWYLSSIKLPAIPFPSSSQQYDGLSAQPMTMWGVADMNGVPYRPNNTVYYMVRRYLPGG